MKKYKRKIELEGFGQSMLAIALFLFALLLLITPPHPIESKECPSGFTCTKNPVYCSFNVWQYGAEVMYWYNGKHYEAVGYFPSNKNGTEIPRCET